MCTTATQHHETQERQIQQGSSLTSALKQSRCFPGLIQQLAAVGEASGALDQMFERVALYYEEQVDHDNQSLKAGTLNAIGAAAKIGGEVHLLVAGHQCAAVADAAKQVSGVQKVLLADDGIYSHLLAENLAPLVVGLAKGYSHILAAATTSGKNFMLRSISGVWVWMARKVARA